MSSTRPRVLIIESHSGASSETQRAVSEAREALEKDFEVVCAADLPEATQRLSEGGIALLLLGAHAAIDAGLCRGQNAGAIRSRPKTHADEARSELRFGDLELDAQGDCVTIETHDGRLSIRLTHREFRLLLCLARAGGKILSREQLIRNVWDADTRITGRTVDTHICKLRKKLSSSRFTIHSVYGSGYRIVAPAGPMDGS